MEPDPGEWDPAQEEAGDSARHRQVVTEGLAFTEWAEEACPGDVAGAEPGEVVEDGGGEAELLPHLQDGTLPTILTGTYLERMKLSFCGMR